MSLDKDIWNVQDMQSKWHNHFFPEVSTDFILIVLHGINNGFCCVYVVFKNCGYYAVDKWILFLKCWSDSSGCVYGSKKHLLDELQPNFKSLGHFKTLSCTPAATMSPAVPVYVCVCVSLYLYERKGKMRRRKYYKSVVCVCVCVDDQSS